MPIEIEAPDGSIVEFPDGTSDDVMANAMRAQFGSTAPESSPDIAGPLRPRIADVEADLQRQEGELLIPEERRERVRGLAVAFPEDEQAQAQTALATDEAKFRTEQGLRGAAPGFGVSGLLGGKTFDALGAGVDAGLNALGLGGQPFRESLETRTQLRNENFEENPLLTAAGGIAAVPSLPFAQPFNATRIPGFIGNAAVNAGILGGVTGAGEGIAAGEGETVGDIASQAAGGALKGAAINAPLGAVGGAAFSKFRPQAAIEGQRAARAAQEGIALPKAAATESANLAGAVGAASKLPFIGGGASKRLQGTIDDIAKGLGRNVERLSGRSIAQESAADAGGRIIQQARVFLERTVPQKLGRAEKFLARSIPRNANGQLNNLNALKQRLTQEADESTTQAFQPIFDKIDQAVKNGRMTFQGMRSLREDLGELARFGEGVQPKTQAAFRRAWGAVTEDIKALAKAHNAEGAFRTTMRTERELIVKRAQVEKLVGKPGQSVNEETIINKIGDWASTGRGASLRNLERLRGILSDDAMENAGAVLLTQWSRSNKKIGEFSIQNIDKMWKGLTPRGKKAIFGSKPEVIASMDNLRGTIDDMQRILENVNFSNTAYANQIAGMFNKGGQIMAKLGSGAVGAASGGGIASLGLGVGAATASAASAGAGLALGRWVMTSLAKPAQTRVMARLFKDATKFTRIRAGLEPANRDVVNQLLASLERSVAQLADSASRDPMLRDLGLAKEEIREQIIKQLSPNEFLRAGPQ